MGMGPLGGRHNGGGILLLTGFVLPGAENARSFRLPAAAALQKSTGLFADRLRQGKALSDRLPAAAALQKSTGLFADRLRE